MNNSTTTGESKPLGLRVIFILNALKIILSASLYIGFKYNPLTIGTLSHAESASIILYTTAGYVITFIVMVMCILKRNITGVRLVIIADFLISIPTKASLAMVIAIISIALTFTTAVKNILNGAKREEKPLLVHPRNQPGVEAYVEFFQRSYMATVTEI